MIFIKNLLYFTAILVLVALGALLLPTSQAQAGRPCLVDITKETIPSDDVTDFDFTCTGGVGGDCDGFSNFSLMDGETKGFGFNDDGVESMITVVEEVPEGWGLGDISCEVNQGNPNTITFDLNSVENGVFITCLGRGTESTCTFRNIRPRNVPTLSEWGLIAMAGVLGIIGLLAIRRRKVAA